jgi:putative endonuclease
MGWFVYLIECADGSLYTGIAIDVDRRYREHAAGKGARYTRSHPPARLLASFPHPDRSAALKAEAAMKKLTAAGKRALAAQSVVAATAPDADHAPVPA